MDSVICPHCKTHRMVTSRVPKDVVVVMPCPSCHELAVLFRNKVIALSRSIIESGSFEQRKMHLAQVIAEFLDAGLFSFRRDGEGFQASAQLHEVEEDEDDEEAENLISEQEIDQFVRIDLKSLDDPAYFKKHFGK